jgi:hypothetical protein
MHVLSHFYSCALIAYITSQLMHASFDTSPWQHMHNKHTTLKSCSCRATSTWRIPSPSSYGTLVNLRGALARGLPNQRLALTLAQRSNAHGLPWRANPNSVSRGVLNEVPPFLAGFEDQNSVLVCHGSACTSEFEILATSRRLPQHSG